MPAYLASFPGLNRTAAAAGVTRHSLETTTPLTPLSLDLGQPLGLGAWAIDIMQARENGWLGD